MSLQWAQHVQRPGAGYMDTSQSPAHQARERGPPLEKGSPCREAGRILEVGFAIYEASPAVVQRAGLGGKQVGEWGPGMASLLLPSSPTWTSTVFTTSSPQGHQPLQEPPPPACCHNLSRFHCVWWSHTGLSSAFATPWEGGSLGEGPGGRPKFLGGCRTPLPLASPRVPLMMPLTPAGPRSSSQTGLSHLYVPGRDTGLIQGGGSKQGPDGRAVSLPWARSGPLGPRRGVSFHEDPSLRKGPVGSAMSGCSRPVRSLLATETQGLRFGGGCVQFLGVTLQFQLGPTDTTQVPQIQAHGHPAVTKVSKQGLPSCQQLLLPVVSTSHFQQASRCFRGFWNSTWVPTSLVPSTHLKSRT